jgi:hypothetical protein
MQHDALARIHAAIGEEHRDGLALRQRGGVPPPGRGTLDVGAQIWGGATRMGQAQYDRQEAVFRFAFGVRPDAQSVAPCGVHQDAREDFAHAPPPCVSLANVRAAAFEGQGTSGDGLPAQHGIEAVAVDVPARTVGITQIVLFLRRSAPNGDHSRRLQGCERTKLVEHSELA